MYENKHSLTFSSLRWVECAGRGAWLDAWSDMPELKVVNAPIIVVSKRNVISNSSSVGCFSERVDTGKMLIHIQVYCTLCSNNYESSYNRDSSVLSTITLQTSIISAQHTHITPLFPLHYLYCVNHKTAKMHNSPFLWNKKHNYHNSIKQSKSQYWRSNRESDSTHPMEEQKHSKHKSSRR